MRSVGRATQRVDGHTVLQIERVVSVFKESTLAAITPPGDVMRDAGEDDSGKSGHGSDHVTWIDDAQLRVYCT